jgi:hypothetical protein
VPDHLIPKPPQLPRSKHTRRQCSAFTSTRNWRCSDQPRSLILLYLGGNDVGPSAGPHLRAHEQQKASLDEQEAKLKDAGRKARTRRLIESISTATHCMGRCCPCATVPTIRTRSTFGPRQAVVPSPARHASRRLSLAIGPW